MARVCRWRTRRGVRARPRPTQQGNAAPVLLDFASAALRDRFQPIICLLSMAAVIDAASLYSSYTTRRCAHVHTALYDLRACKQTEHSSPHACPLRCATA